MCWMPLPAASGAMYEVPAPATAAAAQLMALNTSQGSQKPPASATRGMCLLFFFILLFGFFCFWMMAAPQAVLCLAGHLSAAGTHAVLAMQLDLVRHYDVASM